MAEQSWVDIFRETSILTRFAMAVILIVVAALGITWGVFALLNWYQPVTSVSFEKTTVVLSAHHHTQGAFLSVPANQVWVSTGLYIKPGQTVTITAGGSVNLAVYRLAEAARMHLRPPLPWMGPEGLDLSGRQESVKQSDPESREMLLDKRFPQGALLGYLQHNEEPVLGRFNPRPTAQDHRIFDVGKCFAFTASQEESGTLWLSVNDDYLNERRFESVFVKYHDPSQKASNRKEMFDRIMKDSYYELYFNDNIGEFDVQISFDPQQQGCM